MIVYGSSLSPFVRKVLVFAAEKGIEVESRAVAPGGQDPEFREASPFRKIPGFRDGDYTLADSSAIVHYLEAARPERPLIPAEPKARGKAIWYDEFADTVLFVPGGKIFFNRIVGPLFLGQPGDPAVAEEAERDELPPLFDYLEGAVGKREYLVGDQLTLADIAVASPFVNFRHTDITVDAGRWQRLAAYIERMLARPSFAALAERETAFLARTA